MKTKNILLTIGGILLADYLLAKVNTNPQIIIKKNLPFNYNAQTIPPFGIYILETEKDNKKLLEHELVHWKQYNKSGAILFYLKYLAQKSFYGYDKMPLEIEARKLVGENNYCQNNYTNCVKNGDSITVSNSDFREF
jgi:hypothetical protein